MAKNSITKKRIDSLFNALLKDLNNYNDIVVTKARPKRITKRDKRPSTKLLTKKGRSTADSARKVPPAIAPSTVALPDENPNKNRYGNLEGVFSDLPDEVTPIDERASSSPVTGRGRTPRGEAPGSSVFPGFRELLNIGERGGLPETRARGNKPPLRGTGVKDALLDDLGNLLPMGGLNNMALDSGAERGPNILQRAINRLRKPKAGSVQPEETVAAPTEDNSGSSYGNLEGVFSDLPDEVTPRDGRASSSPVTGRGRTRAPTPRGEAPGSSVFPGFRELLNIGERGGLPETRARGNKPPLRGTGVKDALLDDLGNLLPMGGLNNMALDSGADRVKKRTATSTGSSNSEVSFPGYDLLQRVGNMGRRQAAPSSSNSSNSSGSNALQRAINRLRPNSGASRAPAASALARVDEGDLNAPFAVGEIPFPSGSNTSATPSGPNAIQKLLSRFKRGKGSGTGGSSSTAITPLGATTAPAVNRGPNFLQRAINRLRPNATPGKGPDVSLVDEDANPSTLLAATAPSATRGPNFLQRAINRLRPNSGASRAPAASALARVDEGDLNAPFAVGEIPFPSGSNTSATPSGPNAIQKLLSRFKRGKGSGTGGSSSTAITPLGATTAPAVNRGPNFLQRAINRLRPNATPGKGPDVSVGGDAGSVGSDLALSSNKDPNWDFYTQQKPNRFQQFISGVREAGNNALNKLFPVGTIDRQSEVNPVELAIARRRQEAQQQPPAAADVSQGEPREGFGSRARRFISESVDKYNPANILRNRRDKAYQGRVGDLGSQVESYKAAVQANKQYQALAKEFATAKGKRKKEIKSQMQALEQQYAGIQDSKAFAKQIGTQRKDLISRYDALSPADKARFSEGKDPFGRKGTQKVPETQQGTGLLNGIKKVPNYISNLFSQLGNIGTGKNGNNIIQRIQGALGNLFKTNNSTGAASTGASTGAASTGAASTGAASTGTANTGTGTGAVQGAGALSPAQQQYQMARQASQQLASGVDLSDINIPGAERYFHRDRRGVLEAFAAANRQAANGNWGGYRNVLRELGMFIRDPLGRNDPTSKRRGPAGGQQVLESAAERVGGGMDREGLRQAAAGYDIDDAMKLLARLRTGGNHQANSTEFINNMLAGAYNPNGTLSATEQQQQQQQQQPATAVAPATAPATAPAPVVNPAFQAVADFRRLRGEMANAISTLDPADPKYIAAVKEYKEFIQNNPQVNDPNYRAQIDAQRRLQQQQQPAVAPATAPAAAPAPVVTPAAHAPAPAPVVTPAAHAPAPAPVVTPAAHAPAPAEPVVTPAAHAPAPAVPEIQANDVKDNRTDPERNEVISSFTSKNEDLIILKSVKDLKTKINKYIKMYR